MSVYSDGSCDVEDEEDEEYDYEEEDDEEDNNNNSSSSSASSSSSSSHHRQQQQFSGRVGFDYDGVIVEDIKDPFKNAVYAVYRQLSELMSVEVSADNFFTATICIFMNHQAMMASLEFPSDPKGGAMFPMAPPVLTLQCSFQRPNEKYNLIFNCHPQLLRSRWNICTDIVQVFKDIIEVFKMTSIESIDQADSVYSQISKVFRTFEIDISGLIPESEFHSLPSFGIINTAKRDEIVKNKGTGYSNGYASQDQKWDSFMSVKVKHLELVLAMSRKVQSLIADDTKSLRSGEKTLLVDCVYYALGHVITSTITPEEFFHNLQYYASTLDCVHGLPDSSAHIPPVLGFLHLQETLENDKLKDCLEPEERPIVDMLDAVCERFKRIAASASASYSTPQSVDSRASSTSSGIGFNPNKRTLDELNTEPCIQHLTCSDGKKAASREGDGGSNGGSSSSGSSSSSNSSGSKSSSGTTRDSEGKGPLPPSASEGRVVQLGDDDAFTSHIYLSNMATVAKMSAKWYRKLRIELATMNSSLSPNIMVYSGMSVSQPNLLRCIMSPESCDCPYYGGVFVFDVFIPETYPDVPPLVNIATTGGGSVRFNPNLYNCGKVCLSLLGTWQGEPWNPSVSNMTQIFHSILFLIFTDEPYFNEPGYQSSQNTDAGRKQSNAYNSTIRVATLRFAYLEHLKRLNSARRTSAGVAKGGSRCVDVAAARMARDSWCARGGKGVAQKWAESESAVQREVILELIGKIDAEVHALDACKLLDPPLAPAAQAVKREAGESHSNAG